MAVCGAGAPAAAQDQHPGYGHPPRIGVQTTIGGTRTTLGVGQHGFGRGAVVVVPDGRVLPFGRGVDRPSIDRIEPDIRVFRVQDLPRGQRGSGHPVYRFYYGD